MMSLRELTRSFVGASWSASLWGAERTFALVSPATWRGGAGSAGDGGFDAFTWAARQELALPFQALFHAGEELQREWTDVFFDAVAPRRRRAAFVGAAASGVEGLRFASPDASGAAMRRELANKLEVFWWVKGAGHALGIPADGAPFGLAEKVERAFEYEPHRALWLLEGLGHDWVRSRLQGNDRPSGLLVAEPLPEPSLFMLHAGLGLALAEHLLRGIPPRTPTGELSRLLDTFFTLAEESSRSGYLEAALESLGLVVRWLYPELVPAVDRALRDDDQRLAYFWHGVGRALYFAPVNMLPGHSSTWHALAMARREAPHGLARESGLMGVAYAAVLVNLAHPVVLEDLLARHGEEVAAAPFREGLVSSLLMRRFTTPDDPVLERFLAHRPAATDLAARWRELVSEPCAVVLNGQETAPSAAPVGQACRRLGKEGAA